MLMLEWQNRGLNLWTVQEGTTSITAGTARYALSADILDVIEAFIRTDSGSTTQQVDQPLSRISVSQYAHLTNKLTQAKPLQYWLEKDPAAISFNLWPVPDDAETYTLVYYYMQRVEDTGAVASNNMDVPKLFLPALASGLAFYVAMKQPEAANRLPMLQAEYERQWELAAEENRVKAPFRFVPFQSYISVSYTHLTLPTILRV